MNLTYSKLLVLQTKIWASICAEDEIDTQREMIELIHDAEKQGGVHKSRQAAEFADNTYGCSAGHGGDRLSF